MQSLPIPIGWMAWMVAAALWAPIAQAQDYVDRYALTANTATLQFGTQPLSYPNGVIGAVLRHDRLLRKALEKLGTPFRPYGFKRGADMLPLIMNDKLDAGMIGDMPTTIPASAGMVWIVGLVEVSQNAVIAPGGTRMEDLRGKRIGYVPVSTAHSTLLQSLASAGVGVNEVQLVSMNNADLPAALAHKDIDAFAGWEPASSNALQDNPKNRVIFRSESVDYFVIRREFERQHPQAARELVAGYLRAVEWLRRSPKNQQLAAQWVLQEGENFSGMPGTMSVDQVVNVTRRGLLNIPSAPVIVQSPGGQPLKVEFNLLKSLDRLPPNAQWTHVVDSFGYTGMRDVLANPRMYSLRTFDYDQ